MIETFAEEARRRIRLPEGGYRRDHLRALALHVEVHDTEGSNHGNAGHATANTLSLVERIR